MSFHAGNRLSILFWLEGFCSQARRAPAPSTERLQLQDLQTGILGVVKSYEPGCGTADAHQGTVEAPQGHRPQCLLSLGIYHVTATHTAGCQGG